MTVEANAPAEAVTYCHCNDCRRLSGAPVAAFAAFAENAVSFRPDKGRFHSSTSGVNRWSCPECGTQLAATYDYLPGQIYVPIGVFDQVAELTPSHHSHASSALPWLHLNDDLSRSNGSGRKVLKSEDKP
ncbi:MAG: GFA family protein [Arenibacterium sp.]